MKEIWIVQTGEPMPSDSGQRPMRAINLSESLFKNGFKVKIITSKFFHQKKIHRKSDKKFFSNSIEEVYIDSPGYKKNLSFSRLFDHAIIAINLKKYLKSISKKPDLIFVGFPPIEFAYVATKWAHKNKIPCIIDIKDQWPNLFYENRPILVKLIMKLIFVPYDMMAKSSIIKSSSITGPTESYIHWALKKSNIIRRNKDRPFALVSDKAKASNKMKKSNQIIKGYNELKQSFNILFVGSHMSVFDFKHIAKAASRLQTYKDIKFIICGDGDYLESNKFFFRGLDNTLFPGWVNIDEYRELADISSCAIAPYKDISNYRDNIPNKITDYLSFGLPIIWSLSGEVKNLINNYQCGLIYQHGSGKDLSKKILMLKNSPNHMIEYSENAINLHKSLFNKENIYNDLVIHIKDIISGK